MITVTVFNISSDLAMLLIPVPLIARSMLPLRRKLVLCAVFSAGLLVVVVAILNRYFNFTLPNDLVFLTWYAAEAATAVIIANVPFMWPLLRKILGLGEWSDSITDDRVRWNLRCVHKKPGQGVSGGYVGGTVGRPGRIPPTIGRARVRRVLGRGGLDELDDDSITGAELENGAEQLASSVEKGGPMGGCDKAFEREQKSG